MEYQRLPSSERKLIASLSSAKGRRESSLFVAEGWKCISELLPAFRCRCVVLTPEWMEGNRNVVIPEGAPVWKAHKDEMERISSLRTPQGVLAVFEMPGSKSAKPRKDELYLALDCVQDPGNLGTIIRLANWFGIKRIYASCNTVDVFNPKVVQSTMGGLSNVEVEYCSLTDVLAQASKEGIDIYGTFLNGEVIYEAELSCGGIIVMGNEGNGISPEVEALCSQRITIPAYPSGEASVESLNVSMATSIVVAEFRRRYYM